MEFRFEPSFWEYILLALLLVSALGTFLFHWKIYRPIPKYPSIPTGPSRQGISIVLSGKNHYESLKQNLEFWLKQDYPEFEVIVVHEKTDEETHLLLESMGRQYPMLREVNANQSINFFDEEKFSLSIGVRAARYDCVILTSPLYRPASTHCIEAMQAAFFKDVKVVIGGVVSQNDPKKICSFRHFLETERRIEYTGFALQGKAFTAERPLIAYRKDFFLEHQGYTGSYAIETGNFDLLAKHIGSSQDVRVQMSAEATVIPVTALPVPTAKAERAYQNILSFQQTPASGILRSYHALESLFSLAFLSGCILFGFQLGQLETQPFPSWFFYFISVGIFHLCYQAVSMQKAGKRFQSGLFWFALPVYGFLYISLLFALIARIKRR